MSYSYPELTHPEFLGKTLPEGFYRRYLKHPYKPLFHKKVNGKWVDTTYHQALTQMFSTMAGLRKMGFQKGDKICIYSDNREEWVTTDYACMWLGGATTAVYSTSTPDQIEYMLHQSETKVLFVSNEVMLKRIANIKNLGPHLKAIVTFDKTSLKNLGGALQVYDREEFCENAISEAEAVELLKQIDPEDLCCILYTSGTTGEPKGVMLSHRNMLSDLIAMVTAVPDIGLDKVTLSFLPLSHIYERSLHNIWLQIGFRVYFAESLEKLIENIAEVRPQIMNAVPRIFEKMYARINERMKNARFLQKKIFYASVAIGKKVFPYSFHGKPVPFHLKILHSIADVLVFRKIRAITGGRAELFISGGAPLSTEIAEFFFDAGFLILEGYGLSETVILSCNMPGKMKIGSVGIPFKGVEVKIASDGEILVRGPMVMQGYFKKPQETAEVLSPDGWFSTGDIGEIDSEGFLKITDRKKDLIVTAGGKKIAPQPIENALKGDPLVDAVCLVGDDKKYVVALIVPNLELCRSWGQKKGIYFRTLPDCATNEQLRDHFQREINRVNETLPKFSTVKDFRMIEKPFSMETGELTPTLKLKRRVIQERYRTLIESMYREDERSAAAS